MDERIWGGFLRLSFQSHTLKKQLYQPPGMFHAGVCMIVGVGGGDAFKKSFCICLGSSNSINDAVTLEQSETHLLL